jgi:ArsR family transcriptional regulator
LSRLDETIDYNLIEKQAAIFKAVSNKTRLAILELLSKKDLCVNEIVAELGNAERTGISKHLNILRNHGLVDFYEKGTKRYYSLKAHCLINAIHCTLEIINK